MKRKKDKGNLTKQITDYPHITGPRKKGAPQTWRVLLDPTGGHGEQHECFEIQLSATAKEQEALKEYRHTNPKEFAESLLTLKPVKPPRTRCLLSCFFTLKDISIKIKVAPESMIRLKRYLTNDLQGVLNDLDYQFFDRITSQDWDDPVYYGQHAKTHSIEAAIRSIAPKIYVITNFWLSQPNKSRPKLFNKFLKIVKKQQEEKEYFIQDERPDLCLKARRITHVAILESSLGTIALESGLTLFKTKRGDTIYLKTADFFKSYVSGSFISRLEGLFSNQEDQERLIQIGLHWTTIWLKYLTRKKDNWIDILNLQKMQK